MSDYIIVCRYMSYDLVEDVNKLVNEGYVPQGGVFIVRDELHQPMFKADELKVELSEPSWPIKHVGEKTLF